MMIESKLKTPHQSAYQLAEQVGFIMRRANQRHLTIFSEHIPDLTPTQFAALAKLCELKSVSQNELGRQTAMDAATIKGVVDRLGKRGYVVTTPDPGDLRRLNVTPSDTGIETFRGYIEAARIITEETLAPLNPGERETFLKFLRKIT